MTSIYCRSDLKATFGALVEAFGSNDFEVMRDTVKELSVQADIFCKSIPEASPELLLANNSRDVIRNCMERVDYFCSSPEGDSIKKVINNNNKLEYRKIPLISPGLVQLGKGF